MPDLLQPTVHYSLHLLAPGLIAFVFFRESWLKAWGIMLLTMLVDLDHLLADPLFDSSRCSVGFHPLHSYPAMAAYVGMLFPDRTRIVAVGLLFHMLTDQLDCVWTACAAT